MLKYLFLVITFLFFSCGQQNTIEIDEEENLETTIQYKQIEGIDPNLLSLDIYYNSKTNDKKPVVVYIHGGGWCRGDKSNNIENKINLFRSLNYIFVSVNYRLSPFPYEINNPNRIKYPVHNLDFADALRWIYDNINRFGGDKNNIALIGHSAGAHLAALTGTNYRFLENVGLNIEIIKGVSVIDTKAYDINEQINNSSNPEMYINAFGTDSLINIDASPIFNVNSSSIYPRFFIAKRGSAQRIYYVNNFIDTLINNGVSVTQIDCSIYSHSEINDAIGNPNDTVITSALTDFLEECFSN